MTPCQQAIAYMLHNEGGWSDNPLDHGGPTNMGITLSTLKHAAAQLQGHDFDPLLDGDVTVDTLKQLTSDQIEDIIKVEGFWPDTFDQLNRKVAIKTFDFGFNMGARTGIKLLQSACNALSLVKRISVDGVCGPATVALANSLNANLLTSRLVFGATIHYRAIVQTNPSQYVFLQGWLARAERLPVVG